MNKYRPLAALKLASLFIAVLSIFPARVGATGVRIYNPFADPIAVVYQICNEDGCGRNQLRLIYKKTETYLPLKRHDCVVFLRVNTLEGQYKLKTYDNTPCKIDLGGVDHVEGGITFYVPANYYDYQMLCQIEVTGPPRSFIIR